MKRKKVKQDKIYRFFPIEVEPGFIETETELKKEAADLDEYSDLDDYAAHHGLEPYRSLKAAKTIYIEECKYLIKLLRQEIKKVKKYKGISVFTSERRTSEFFQRYYKSMTIYQSEK